MTQRSRLALSVVPLSLAALAWTLTSAPSATSAQPAAAKGATERITAKVNRPTGEKCMPVQVTTQHSKPVFAHYMPAFPVSITNLAPDEDYYATHYLNPDGENGKFTATGGFLRDRPLGRAPLAGSDWKVQDLMWEIKVASASGIDGFAADILTFSGRQWSTVNAMLTAAEKVGNGFSIMLQPDLAGAPGNVTPAQLADQMIKLAKSPAVTRTSTGRLVVSPFLAEKRDANWWKIFLDEMDQRGERVALIPLFVNHKPHMASFAPISFAMSTWGPRDPDSWHASTNTAATARSLGTGWMSTVAVQDVRPHARVFRESANTGTLRASWERAIADNADLVMMATWNDWAESTAFAPSANHGLAFLQYNAVGIEMFQTGKMPTVTQNMAVLTHRPMWHDTVPTQQTTLMTQARELTHVSNRVEGLTLLKEPATLRLNSGGMVSTFRVQPGETSDSMMLRSGRISLSLETASGARMTARTVGWVNPSPAYQDLTYHAASTLCDARPGNPGDGSQINPAAWHR